MTLGARPGFDWSLVKWAGPNEPQPDICSYCSAPIPESSVPLRCWREDKSGSVFCDDCSRDIFGLQTFNDGLYDGCPGHVASEGDPKICGRCGIHIDELRPPEDPEVESP